MKKLLMSLCALCVATSAMASVYDKLIIIQKGGEKVEIGLGESLRMNFTETDLVVSGSNADVTIARSNIRALRHQVYTGVEGVSAEGEFRYTGGALEFTGLADGTEVVVCDASGKVVLSRIASGDCSVSLGDLPAGVYVIAAGKTTYKIVIR